MRVAIIKSVDWQGQLRGQNKILMAILRTYPPTPGVKGGRLWEDAGKRAILSGADSKGHDDRNIGENFQIIARRSGVSAERPCLKWFWTKEKAGNKITIMEQFAPNRAVEEHC